eukprot:5606910-Pleurochrysis_carterae.AAC.2
MITPSSRTSGHPLAVSPPTHPPFFSPSLCERCHPLCERCRSSACSSSGRESAFRAVCVLCVRSFSGARWCTARARGRGRALLARSA